MTQTRRELVRYLTALVASPQGAVAQAEDLPRSGATQHIVILGAGLAGMCAAFELRRQGHLSGYYPGGSNETGRDSRLAFTARRARRGRLGSSMSWLSRKGASIS